MKKQYQNEVSDRLRKEANQSTHILTEKDIAHLPEPIKKYIRFTGFVGKEKITNVFLRASGQIRSSEKSGWMQFTSEQHNFFENPFRAFYIRALKMGIPAVGLHLYKNETATMVIKLLNLFKVVDAKGPEMNQAETVTVLNDMCFMAPGSLINKNITWETMDANQVKAKFTNGQITVSAILTFDEEGKLMNFLSYDRFETADGKIYINNPWETPVKEYRKFGDYYLPSKADIIYKRPDGDFCYLEFRLEEIKYNI
ncbi:MAG: hypothetical protein Q7U86_03300 [Draconibacterium sp.]|nr:hypothetical protein [Draconibacterium sp.]